MATPWDQMNRKEFGLVDRMISATSFNEEQVRLIVKGLQPCQMVLDLCVGFGNVAKVLVEQGKEVRGIDTSPRSLAYARKKVGRGKKGQFYIIKGDVRKMSYESAFDGVSCASSFGFPELDVVTQGVYAALIPGGLFAVTGIESAKMWDYQGIMRNELQVKFHDGSLSFTGQEAAALHKISELLDISKVVDSSERTAESLEDHGFKLLEQNKFYSGTCYFILAEKQ